MSATENPQIAILFEASARDERTLRFDLDHEIFGFHTQQAVEKLLKALLTARGQEFKFTHDLKVLADQVEALGERIPLPSFITGEFAEYAMFNEYAVAARYDLGQTLSVEHRAEIREAISELRTYVQSRVEALRS